MPVVRLVSERICYARGDLAAQLGRGCSCVCNDEEFVKIGGVRGIGQIAHQPVDQILDARALLIFLRQGDADQAARRFVREKYGA